ncbi:protein amalgam isoform X2 [Eurytemora carolleeae]|uniref:protein amalgam isoform X2 n=1 Tax=Eurytemora carolleeae TaxID=1294199 RepID=UPI000C76D9E8|nr:protein amalgam isoform X2 [Eurytemora carolleeae]|eukprot:XP_023324662.1 protein amalgam-like isoform X2 [Eurytemora affinis]
MQSLQEEYYHLRMILHIRYDESELEYIPEITSRPENIIIKPLESVSFPCQAQDADKFVRVWLKNGEMLFTGNIRLTEDSRFSLSEKNTSLVLVNSTTEDSGVYECRIMVKQSLSVQHRLQVTETFSIKSDPPEGVIMVPIHGATEFGCIVIGGSNSSTLSWSRDNIRFRDGSYSVSGSRLKLENVTLEDSGYYYCTTQDSNGVVKAASVHLQVLSTPVILELSKNVLQSGKGLVLEISCSVKGDPKPKVNWYKNGETILESGRIEVGEAGTRSILIIRGFQDGDYGTYVCYARNLLGNLQQSIQVLQADRDNIKQTNTGTGGEGLEGVKEGIRILRKSIEKDHKTMLNFRRRIEKEIEMIKENQGNLSLPVKRTQNSFDKAILSDIGRIKQYYQI